MKEVKLTDVLMIPGSGPVPFHLEGDRIEVYCPWCGEVVLKKFKQDLQIVGNIGFEGEKGIRKHLSKPENKSCNEYKSKVIFDFKVKHFNEGFEGFGMKFKI